MGYAVYEDQDARDSGIRRWAGYGVPAKCDMPECDKRIDRGMGYKCERGHEPENVVKITDASGYNGASDPEFEDFGCGLYFCSDHLYETEKHDVTPKQDLPEWEHHMLRHESWAQWREDNPRLVQEMTARTDGYQCTPDCEHE